MTLPHRAQTQSGPLLMDDSGVKHSRGGLHFSPPDPPRTSRVERASLWLTFHTSSAQHGQGNPTRLHFFFFPSPLSISNNGRSSFQTKKKGLGQTKSTSRKQDGNFMMQCFRFHWTSDSQLFPLFKQKSQGRIIIIKKIKLKKDTAHFHGCWKKFWNNSLYT